MADSEKKGAGTLEIAAAVMVGIFAIVVIFGAFSFIAGAVWWLVKIAILILVLYLIVRWILGRTAR